MEPSTKSNTVNYSPTSPLPPCKICGAKASGLHYGVNTCEACKGFFRRAVKFNKKYTCFREQNCDIIGGRSVRTSCPFCRLQKCLKMGMAHKAIKTGRYTHAKRTENIMEVKRLEKVKGGHRETWATPPLDAVKQELEDIKVKVSLPHPFVADPHQKMDDCLRRGFPPIPPHQDAFHGVHFSDTPPSHPGVNIDDRVMPSISSHPMNKQMINSNNNNNNSSSINSNNHLVNNSNNSSISNDINDLLDSSNSFLHHGDSNHYQYCDDNNNNNNIALDNRFIHNDNRIHYRYCDNNINNNNDDNNNNNTNDNNNNNNSYIFPLEPDFSHNPQLPLQTQTQDPSRNSHTAYHSHRFSHLHPYQTTLTHPELHDLDPTTKTAHPEGIYISIPTPPLSSPPLDEGSLISPHAITTSTTPTPTTTTTNNNKNNIIIHPQNSLSHTNNPSNPNQNTNIMFPFPRIKQEVMDFSENHFTPSHQETPTLSQLLPSSLSLCTGLSAPSPFTFSEMKMENDEMADIDFINSSDRRPSYTQLLPSASSIPSGPTPSPSSLSTSSLSSSASSTVFKLGESSPGPSSPTGLSMLDLTLSDLVSMNDSDKERLKANLLQSHRKCVITLAEYDKTFISTIQKQYLDKHLAKAEMFGLTSNFIQDEFYTEIFSQTGLDVDGRHEMRLNAAKSLGVFLKTVISFAQSVPGFNSLCLGDQQKLVKVSVIEQWFMNAFLGINPRDQVVLMPNLKVFSFDEFANLLGEPFADKCFEMAPVFQSLSISYEMLVLWKIVLLLSTDRPDLADPQLVGRLQDFYLNLLLDLIHTQRASDHPESRNVFFQIISLTSLLRELDTAMPVVFDQRQAMGITAQNLLKPSNS